MKDYLVETEKEMGFRGKRVPNTTSSDMINLVQVRWQFAIFIVFFNWLSLVEIH
jgi:hypothetical protein